MCKKYQKQKRKKFNFGNEIFSYIYDMYNHPTGKSWIT